jgi:hypothetical protein
VTQRKWEWRWIFDAITMVSVMIGLTIGLIELRQFRAAQQAQTVLALYQTLQDPDRIRGRTLLRRLPDSASADEIAALFAGPGGDAVSQALLAYEGMGVMVYRGDISIEWVDELFHFEVVDSWRRVKPNVLARRERTGYPGLLEWLQWLAERLEEHAARSPKGGAYDMYRDWTPPDNF